MKIETENIGFKYQVTDDLYKEVIAFANTDGGMIYIGIDDNGNVIGINNIDENYTRISYYSVYNPDAYPIYDSYLDKLFSYLCILEIKKKDLFYN